MVRYSSTSRVWGEVRMRRVLILALAAIAAVASTSASAKGPFGSIHVGQWTGGAYSDDKTGAFSHCAAGAQYLNGIYLMLSQNKENGWSVAFANPKFQLTAGDTFPIDLTFDGQAQVRLFGTAIK